MTQETTITREQLEGWYNRKDSTDRELETQERMEEEFVFDNGSRFEILEDEYTDRGAEEDEDE